MAANSLSKLTINGQPYDPLADSDKTITIVGGGGGGVSRVFATAPLSWDSDTNTMSVPAGALGKLTINGQPYDPLADSDKTITIVAGGGGGGGPMFATAPLSWDSDNRTMSIPAGALGTLNFDGKLFDPLVDSDASITVINGGTFP